MSSIFNALFQYLSVFNQTFFIMAVLIVFKASPTAFSTSILNINHRFYQFIDGEDFNFVLSNLHISSMGFIIGECGELKVKITPKFLHKVLIFIVLFTGALSSKRTKVLFE